MGRDSSFKDIYHPAGMTVTDTDRNVFNAFLRDELPGEIFDVHAHCYDMEMFGAAPRWVGTDEIRRYASRWMGDVSLQQMVIFPFPDAGMDRAGANAQMVKDLEGSPDCRGLLIVSPEDDPAEMQRLVMQPGIAGFKVYPSFSRRDDPLESTPDEYIPQWVWELADSYGLVIMLHLVLPKGLSDDRNWGYIRRECRRYPQAMLILAHGARGFSPRHNQEGIYHLSGLENLFFDTSVVCEQRTFSDILAAWGPSRLLYGSDFPVSSRRGRIIALGDGFYTLYEDSLPQAVLLGIESLLALVPALDENSRELVFRENARHLFRAQNTHVL